MDESDAFPCPHCGQNISLDDLAAKEEPSAHGIREAEAQFERALLGASRSDREQLARDGERLTYYALHLEPQSSALLAHEVGLIFKRSLRLMNDEATASLRAQVLAIFGD